MHGIKFTVSGADLILLCVNDGAVAYIWAVLAPKIAAMMEMFWNQLAWTHGGLHKTCIRLAKHFGGWWYTLINIDLEAMWYCGINPRTISQETRITTFNDTYKNIYEIPTNPSGSMPGTPSKIVVIKQMVAQCQSNAQGQIIMTYA